jgi:hypothetical protein
LILVLVLKHHPDRSLADLIPRLRGDNWFGRSWLYPSPANSEFPLLRKRAISRFGTPSFRY